MGSRLRDWAGLPGKILDIVLFKLASYREYRSFSLVCKPWLSVVREHEEKEVQSLQPLLLMTAVDLDYEIHIWLLWNVLTGRWYRLWLTSQEFKSFCGCSHGWLAFVDPDNNLSLMNPWSRRTIPLPPLQFEFGSIISKVVLSNNPDSAPLDCLVAAIYGDRDTLAMTKLGRDSWTYVDHRLDFFNDVIFDADDLLLAVDLHARLMSLNPCFDLPCIDAANVNMIVPYCMEVMVDTYIVRSRRSGALLMIRTKPWRRDIQLFKLVMVDERFRWEEIKHLEDETLFVGLNHSISLSCLGIFSALPNRVCIINGHQDCRLDRFEDRPPKPPPDPRFEWVRCPSKLEKLFCLGDGF